ncbi:hypothetical protein OG311_39835 (plasmid) [Streptomyces sp. NBC_01343]|uniref:hypothetical protein n=1 Tax=Streptomyces sp. NBC_01343 TaxID=2903832 RepID=UPI002E14BAE9|nr:hypothetical protein OG311_39835 [Streptomyces sp. NBC_01343]
MSESRHAGGRRTWDGWSTATFANPGAYAHFQSDGNLVVYKKDGGQGKGGAIWHSDTWR